MEFEGVVFKKLPVSKGVSARGEWQRQDVVFEVPSEFSRKICVTFFNKPTEADSLVEGQTYVVSVNVESREYNGKWYTDVRAWRVQRQCPICHRLVMSQVMRLLRMVLRRRQLRRWRRLMICHSKRNSKLRIQN